MRGVIFSLVLLVSQPAFSDEPAFVLMSSTERRAWIIAQAKEYEIRIDKENGELVLEKPVLRFNDNVTGVVDAVQFVWTKGGRPEASASFWFRKDGLKAHEFTSLSRGKLQADRDGARLWDTSEVGLKFKPLPNAKVPHNLKAGRLTQMRQTARRCKAVVKGRDGELNLRLLPQPLVRYSPNSKDILDGAVFSFAKGTNPEVVLIVEAVVDKTGKSTYEYSVARMTSRACWLIMDEEKVWSVPKDGGGDVSGNYHNVYGR